MKKILTTLLSACLCIVCASAAVFGTYDLRCEALVEPLGIDSALPHFSWKIKTDTPLSQLAYEIQVASDPALLTSGKADLWASGKIASSESVMVPYGGKVLASRQLCFWRVKVYTDRGESEWSVPQRFSIGVIGDDALHGEYIGALPEGGKSALLHRQLKLKKAGQTAFMHVNSLGYHELYVNGCKVSDAVLVPAVSELDKRSLIVTYDISSLLRKGENDIVLWTGSGWYKEGTFGAEYGGALVKADLDVMDGGQWNTVLTTDASWKAAESGYADTGTWTPGAFGGERIEAAKVPSGLCGGALSSLTWIPVDVVNVKGLAATPQMCEQNVVKEVLSPLSIEPLGKGRWLVDMGKVLNGQFEIHLGQLPAGHEVVASYSDARKADGSINNRGDDIFVASGDPDGDTFRNKFNHHAFRFVELKNLPEKPSVKEIRAYRISTDYAQAGSFLSSDNDMNRIHDMIAYTMNCLAFSGYMVDCAHIERLGYGGDGNASTLSLQTMYDVSPTYMNWLQAWNDAINEKDGVPHTAPNPYRAGGGPYWCTFIVQAPWRTYMNYGDTRLLSRCYDSMKTFIAYVDRHTVDGLLKRWEDVERRYWYLGDWLAPKGTDVNIQESVDIVNNCAMCQTYLELIEIAGLLGRDDDARDFSRRYEALKARINEAYYHPESCTYASGSQLDMSYPLLTGVVPEELVPSVTAKLYEITETVNNGHLGVGLVGVPILTEWATRSRSVDFMYGMLKKPDYPGYLFMLNNGATGTWEDWSADARSHLHNCFNGIGSWFYQALGGIVSDQPGYRHVKIDPQVPEGMDWARVTKETPYGTIIVHWISKGSELTLHVEIPAGISADICGREVTCGIYDFSIKK